MEDFIPIFAIFCTIGLPIVAWTVFRVLKHRERIEMIRHGIAPEARQYQWNPQQGQGVPFTAPPPQNWDDDRRGRRKKNKHDDDNDPPDVTLRKGVRLAMIGLAITIGLSFIGMDNGSFHPGPWLLGGLIPMFVGLSHVIIATLSGATLNGSAQQWRAGQVPPPFVEPPAAPGPARQTYDTSYTYRPGGTQELQPPHAPPERR